MGKVGKKKKQHVLSRNLPKSAPEARKQNEQQGVRENINRIQKFVTLPPKRTSPPKINK